MVPSLNYIGTAKLAQRWETRHNGKLAGRAVFMRPHPIQYPLIDGHWISMVMSSGIQGGFGITVSASLEKQ
jgi:hypothetical protein